MQIDEVTLRAAWEAGKYLLALALLCAILLTFCHKKGRQRRHYQHPLKTAKDELDTNTFDRSLSDRFHEPVVPVSFINHN